MELLFCVPKASHAYSVGVRPYDIFLSVNGEKFDPLKQKSNLE